MTKYYSVYKDWVTESMLTGLGYETIEYLEFHEELKHTFDTSFTVGHAIRVNQKELAHLVTLD